MRKLTWETVLGNRLERQGLTEPRSVEPAAAVEPMCGAHAQVMSAAEVSVALRTAGAARSDVRRAVWDDHALVKTFGPRGTVHLFPASELGRWSSALAAVPWRSPFPDGVRFTPDETDQVVDSIGRALSAAELTVDELDEALADLAGPWAVERSMPAFQVLWPRWRQLVATAAYRQVLCFGADKGRRVTYTNPARFTEQVVDPPEAAVGWAIRSYLRSYGPATPAQFARWFGAPESWAASAFAALGGELEEVLLDENPAWCLAGDLATPAPAPPAVRLLPYFDAFVVGSHPRDRLFPGESATRALAPSGQAGNYPVLLLDGIVAGVWHARRSGKRVEITVESLRKLSKSQLRHLDQQAARVGEIVEATPTLTIGPLTVGPHA